MVVIPKIKDLAEDIYNDLQSEFSEITVPIFGKVFLKVVAGVLAMRLYLYYLKVAALQKNIFLDTADPESKGGTLERWGRAKLNRNPFPAKQGQYIVTVTGVTGGTIAAGTRYVSDNNNQNPGKVFIVDSAYSLPGSTGSMTIRALEAGIESRLSVGETLSVSSPINNVSSQVTVASVAIAAEASEDIEDYRQKGLDAFRLEPQGGASADYRIWSADAQGVKQVYPFAKSGAPNEINVFVEATIADSTDGKGTPTSTILTDVASVIELDPDTTLPTTERGRRPLGVFMVNVLPITVKEIDIDINSYAGIDAAKQANILSALQEAIAEIRPFVDAVDVITERKDVIDRNLITTIVSTAVPGSIYAGVTLRVSGVEMATYTFNFGNIPHLNSVNYV